MSELVVGECGVENEMRKTVVELVLKADCLENDDDDDDDDDAFIMKRFLYDRE
jgi:hypothetical protein